MKRFLYNTMVAAGVVLSDALGSGHLSWASAAAAVGWCCLSAIEWWDERNLERARAMRALERDP